MTSKTPLYDAHVAAGAKIVEFGGWDMPLHYGSQVAEHHVVRNKAGMFDVSHMTVVDVAGPGSARFLRYLLANDVDRLSEVGRGLYSCMLNEAGGVIDDLIAYRTAASAFRLVVNAATRDKDMAWISEQAAAFEVAITERTELCMLAIQGPQARVVCAELLPEGAAEAALELPNFSALIQGEWFIARTGYTGEDGWEIILPAAEANKLWAALLKAGVQPCGLGARDTLRLEAGLNLYGQDMTETTSPLESNLAWTVSLSDERDFIGRTALMEQQAQGLTQRLTGVLLEGRGVMRAGQPVRTASGDGVITSGGFSPTMERSIALARIPLDADGACEINIRNRLVPARLLNPPFVRNGEIKCGDE